NVLGALDGVDRALGGVRVRGWSLDRTTAAPTQVHAYVDGTWDGSAQANGSRPDVGAAFGQGDAHGFDFTVPAAPGVRSICLYGINDDASAQNYLLGCRGLLVGTAPFGNLEDVTRVPAGIAARGWAIDPDTATSIAV